MTTVTLSSGTLYHTLRVKYGNWCWKNLFVPGTAITYKFVGDKVIFLHEEDATAFKLRFGL